MALPISAKKTKTYGTPTGQPQGSAWFVRHNWQTQAKPYDYILPYTREQGFERWGPSKSGNLGYGPSSYCKSQSNIVSIFSLSGAEVENECRSKLYGKSRFGTQAQVGAALAELRQSAHMIAVAALHLRLAYSAVRKFRFKQAARLLGMKLVPAGVSRRKTTANNWLEYHFGWAPLIGDIFDSVEVLQGPIMRQKVSATAASRMAVRTQGAYPKHPAYGYTNSRKWGSFSVRSGFRFEIENPNLWLANRLGLVNPASVAWEVVPFSFVVDWFIPVGEFLNRTTATVGLRCHSGYTTYRAFYQEHSLTRRYNDHNDIVPSENFGNGTWIERKVGALSALPSFEVRPGFSPMRAAHSVALLIQAFKRE